MATDLYLELVYTSCKYYSVASVVANNRLSAISTPTEPCEVGDRVLKQHGALSEVRARGFFSPLHSVEAKRLTGSIGSRRLTVVSFTYVQQLWRRFRGEEWRSQLAQTS